MKAKEIKGLGRTELEERLRTLGDELFDARFKHTIRQLGDTSRMRKLRRDIARVKTAITQVAGKAGR